MKIVTFNIRCVWDKDGINSFIHRIGLICDKIAQERPDVISFQEVTDRHREMLSRMLPEYLIVGQGRNADCLGEGVSTAVRRDTIDLLGFETIWLSPTPHIPASRYENQSYIPRVLLMTLLKNKKTGERFRVYNAHLDHLSSEGRISQIEGLLAYVNEQQGKSSLPTVILGDLNAEPDSDEIKLIGEQGAFTDLTATLERTFHNFGTPHPATKIDYVFTTAELTVRAGEAVVWTDEKNGIYLSDHYPVSVIFED